MATLVKDSTVPDTWIKTALNTMPCQRQLDSAGNPTDCVLTGVVRLAFCEYPYGGLLRPNKPMADTTGAAKEPKFTTVILFVPGADLSPLYSLYAETLAKLWSDKRMPNGAYPGLHSPFRDQAEKGNLHGYTPGGVFITATSKFKPAVVDQQMNPIVDEEQVRSGVWANVLLRPFAYGRNPPQPKKGVSFGLQAVMVIGQDQRLSGGQVDAKSVFGGLGAIAPTGDPASLFGGGQPPAAPKGVECFFCGAVKQSKGPCPECGFDDRDS